MIMPFAESRDKIQNDTFSEFCCSKECLQPPCEGRPVLCFAFPNDDRIPSLFAASREIAGITRAVALELCLPE